MNKLVINAVFNDDMPNDLGERDGWQRLDLWEPSDRLSMSLSLTLVIGMQGIVGTNLFWLEVCTKQYAALVGTYYKSQFVLIVDEFDWLKIKPMIVVRVEACDRGDWEWSVAELRKHFVWEYETEQTTRREIQTLPLNFFPAPDRDNDD